MRKSGLLLAVSVVSSLLMSNFMVADEFPTPRGGFLIGRIAAKKIKKMREQEHFSGADQDKDGKLDRQEVESAKKAHGNFIDDETFKKIDTDGDGKLSHDECEKYQKEAEKAESDAKDARK
ncbi:MAG: EF-hand domain-containing protein [Victivallales bacterium]